MSVEKLGVLRKNTVIHTEDMTFRVEKGTSVVVSSDTLRFRDKDLVAYKEGDGFYVKSKHSETPYKVRFPNGGVPYPFTIL